MKNSRHQMLSSIQGEECFCCMNSRIRTNCNFAECEHTGICKTCGEKLMVASMKDNIIPLCFMQQCGAVMSTKQNSLFEYYSYSNKKRWEMKEKEMNVSKINVKLRKPCKKPDCKGNIKSNQCMVCSTAYCLNCGQFDHDPTKKCVKKKEDTPFQGVKNCPSCQVLICKDKGCNKISCPFCRKQFCFECLEKWDKSHHTKHGVVGCCSGFTGFFYEHLCCCLFSNSQKYHQELVFSKGKNNKDEEQNKQIKQKQRNRMQANNNQQEIKTAENTKKQEQIRQPIRSSQKLASRNQ